MKRYFAFLLSLVLLVSALTIPASAATKYDYEPFTVTSYFGSEDLSKATKVTYTFDQAATGYLITDRYIMEVGERPDYIASGEVFNYPCVILKDNSRVTVDIPDNFQFWETPAGYSNDFDEIVLWGTDEDGAIHDWTGYHPVVTTGKVERLIDHAAGPAIACAPNNWGEVATLLVLESQVKYFNIFKEESQKRDGIDLSIYDRGDGKALGYTVSNQGNKDVNGYYALLSYWPETDYHAPTVIAPTESEHFRGQILPLDIDLAPGESMSGDCWAVATGWSTMTHKWIKFDSKAERDLFFKASVLEDKFGVYEIDLGTAGIRWMKDTFGITIRSGKN